MNTFASETFSLTAPIDVNPTWYISVFTPNSSVPKISQTIPQLRIKTYCPPGKEVGSSCGEFTKHYYHEEIETEEQKQEFERWKVKHLVLE